jgi:hypothetical protein
MVRYWHKVDIRSRHLAELAQQNPDVLVSAAGIAAIAYVRADPTRTSTPHWVKRPTRSGFGIGG